MNLALNFKLIFDRFEEMNERWTKQAPTFNTKALINKMERKKLTMREAFDHLAYIQKVDKMDEEYAKKMAESNRHKKSSLQRPKSQSKPKEAQEKTQQTPLHDTMGSARQADPR